MNAEELDVLAVSPTNQTLAKASAPLGVPELAEEWELGSKGKPAALACRKNLGEWPSLPHSQASS